MPIQEQGKVVAVEDGNMILSFTRREACGHCMACTIARRQELRLKLPNQLGAKEGDLVLVELRQGLLAPALAYDIPLCALFLGLALGWVLGGEKWAAIGGLSGAIGGLISLKLVDPLARRKLSPYPLRIVKE